METNFSKLGSARQSVSVYVSISKKKRHRNEQTTGRKNKMSSKRKSTPTKLPAENADDCGHQDAAKMERVSAVNISDFSPVPVSLWIHPPSRSMYPFSTGESSRLTTLRRRDVSRDTLTSHTELTLLCSLQAGVKEFTTARFASRKFCLRLSRSTLHSRWLFLSARAPGRPSVVMSFRAESKHPDSIKLGFRPGALDKCLWECFTFARF